MKQRARKLKYFLQDIFSIIYWLAVAKARQSEINSLVRIRKYFEDNYPEYAGMSVDDAVIKEIARLRSNL